MESFYQEITELSKVNENVRVEKQKQKQIEHQMNIKNAMEQLFSTIVNGNDVANKMKSVASEGYNKCELFSFQSGDRFKDFPLIFLTRGPQNYNGFGLKYFEEMNINPYIKQLQQYYTPFNVYYSTNYKTNKTSIMISW